MDKIWEEMYDAAIRHDVGEVKFGKKCTMLQRRF